jgi:hypothetical protein
MGIMFNDSRACSASWRVKAPKGKGARMGSLLAAFVVPNLEISKFYKIVILYASGCFLMLDLRIASMIYRDSRYTGLLLLHM